MLPNVNGLLLDSRTYSFSWLEAFGAFFDVVDFLIPVSILETTLFFFTELFEVTEVFLSFERSCKDNDLTR